MDQIVHRILEFDRFALDLTRGCLRGPDQDIDLRPKTFEVLRYLAENGGRLVPKRELHDAVWSNVYVSDDSLVQCIRELRDRLGDDGHRLIKTVSRRGYLLDATVTARAPQQILSQAPGPETSQILTPKTSGADRAVQGHSQLAWAIYLTILLGVYLTAAGYWASMPPRVVEDPGRPVAMAPDPRPLIIVMPFKNAGGDPGQEYFADGVTDSLTESLGRIGSIVARSTAFSYKGIAIDIRQIGRELGVRYALEGTVRRSGDEVRVTAQLVDTSTAANVWTETFDVVGRDVVQLRDDLTARLANFLDLGLVYAESARSLRERSHDPQAWDFLMRAWALYYTTPRGRDMAEVQRLFREVLRRDETLVGAWVGLSLTYLRDVRLPMRLSPRDPTLPGWQMYMGAICLHLQRDEEAIDWLNKSVALSPDAPFTRLFLASALALSGRDPEAKREMAELLRIRPDFTLSRFIALEPSDVPSFRMQRERIYEGLRRAGVPE